MSNIKQQQCDSMLWTVGDMGLTESHQPLPRAFPSNTELAFYDLRERLEMGGETLAKKVNAVLGFKVTDQQRGRVDGWVVDLRHGRAAVRRDDGQKTDIVFYIAENDLVNLFQGSQQPQKLLLTRKLRISGTRSLQNTIQYLVAGNKRRKCKL